MNPSPDSAQTAMPNELTAHEYFERDFRGFSRLAAQRDGNWPLKCCIWSLDSDLADDVEIPNSLLLGPWSEELIKYLFWAVKSGARVHWLKSTSGEVSQFLYIECALDLQIMYRLHS